MRWPKTIIKAKSVVIKLINLILVAVAAEDRGRFNRNSICRYLDAPSSTLLVHVSTKPNHPRLIQ